MICNFRSTNTSAVKRASVFHALLLVVLIVAATMCSNDKNINRSFHVLVGNAKVVPGAPGGHSPPLARLLQKADPKTVESKIQLPGGGGGGGQPRGRAFFFTTLSKSTCCLNNGFFSTMGYIVKACKLADKPNDVVILPPDLDANGTFLTNFKLFAPHDIENLQTIARETMACTIVHESSQMMGANIERVEVPLASMIMNSPVTKWFYRSLTLPPHLTRAWSTCYSNFIKNDTYTAVHLRIEEDWTKFVNSREDLSNSTFSPAQIASAMSTAVDAPTKVIFIHGDPDPAWAYGTGESAWEVWKKYNPRHDFIHKSRLNRGCTRELNRLTYNDNAMMDLWVAVNSKIFAGHLGSSFSAAVTQARHQRDASNEDYVYSCPQKGKLARRWDGGHVFGSTKHICGLATTHFAGSDR